MSDSVRPLRLQPSRLHCSWDSSGKNTGVGCRFLLQCMKVKKWKWDHSCATLCNPMDCSPLGSSAHGIFQARVLEWGAIAFSATPSIISCYSYSVSNWRIPDFLPLEMGHLAITKECPGGAGVKNLPANAGDTKDVGLIPGSGRSLGEGNGNPLQYSYLEKSSRPRSLVGYSPWGHRVRHDWAHTLLFSL